MVDCRVSRGDDTTTHFSLQRKDFGRVNDLCKKATPGVGPRDRFLRKKPTAIRLYHAGVGARDHSYVNRVICHVASPYLVAYVGPVGIAGATPGGGSTGQCGALDRARGDQEA